LTGIGSASIGEAMLPPELLSPVLERVIPISANHSSYSGSGRNGSSLAVMEFEADTALGLGEYGELRDG
jgi:hypothetical protein